MQLSVLPYVKTMRSQFFLVIPYQMQFEAKELIGRDFCYLIKPAS
ncbi:hypothetical protein [Aliterella atlantica]|nr:hypothetical protein [Aliterella atlantica]